MRATRRPAIDLAQAVADLDQTAAGCRGVFPHPLNIERAILHRLKHDANAHQTTLFPHGILSKSSRHARHRAFVVHPFAVLPLRKSWRRLLPLEAARHTLGMRIHPTFSTPRRSQRCEHQHAALRWPWQHCMACGRVARLLTLSILLSAPPLLDAQDYVDASRPMWSGQCLPLLDPEALAPRMHARSLVCTRPHSFYL